jgi:serine phosphatase RsbU (regulator of sigma subunit)
MAVYFKDIFRNSSTRILVIIFFSLIMLSVFFMSHSYFTQLDLHEHSELNKLNGVARTLALQIDGDAHQKLYNKYKSKDEISETNQDSVYEAIHHQLLKAQLQNKIGTDIYTLVFNETNNNFEFGVTSGITPYYRHNWLKFKPEHVSYYQKGYSIRPYLDEHGSWLSAFAPLKNSNGDVVAILQVDQEFDPFISLARASILKELAIGIVVFIIVALFLLHSIKTILTKEEEMINELIAQKAEVEEKSSEITASIRYAKTIQTAILPCQNTMDQYFSESFVVYKPKDIVSGDFYWLSPVKNTYTGDSVVVFAVADCTGHGVPGAFLSLIGNNYLNRAITEREVNNPAQALDYLNVGINEIFSENKDEEAIKDGMDISFCSLDRKNMKLEFSGAKNPIYIIRNKKLIEIKGDRHAIGKPVGGNLLPFTNHIEKVEEGDCIYIFSDGFPDQFGGPHGKKFRYKPMKELLLSISGQSMEKQHQILSSTFSDWKGDLEQIDDVCIIGVRV